MTPEQRAFVEGLMLVLIAAACAALSATLVIGIGQTWLHRHGALAVGPSNPAGPMQTDSARLIVSSADAKQSR